MKISKIILWLLDVWVPLIIWSNVRQHFLSKFVSFIFQILVIYTLELSFSYLTISQVSFIIFYFVITIHLSLEHILFYCLESSIQIGIHFNFWLNHRENIGTYLWLFKQNDCLLFVSLFNSIQLIDSDFIEKSFLMISWFCLSAVNPILVELPSSELSV